MPGQGSNAEVVDQVVQGAANCRSSDPLDIEKKRAHQVQRAWSGNGFKLGRMYPRNREVGEKIRPYYHPFRFIPKDSKDLLWKLERDNGITLFPICTKVFQVI